MSVQAIIKSPLNYIGGKYKLLPQILPLMPDNIKVFVDLFGGGFNVGINIDSERVIYNDIVYQVSQLMKKLSETSDKEVLAHISEVAHAHHQEPNGGRHASLKNRHSGFAHGLNRAQCFCGAQFLVLR